jgi:hypothetical protein
VDLVRMLAGQVLGLVEKFAEIRHGAYPQIARDNSSAMVGAAGPL